MLQGTYKVEYKGDSGEIKAYVARGIELANLLIYLNQTGIVDMKLTKINTKERQNEVE